jgi:hypothetical protein
VKAAGPRARLGRDAPGHPLGRDQIGKLELDVHQLFTQVPGLPSELAAALPDPIEHRAHRPAPPAGNCYQRPEHRTVPQMPRPDPGPFTRTTDDQSRRSSPPTGMNTPGRPQTSPPTSAFKLERSQ